MPRWITTRLGRRFLADPDYGFLFHPARSGEVVSLDCETTGFDIRGDDVISIAAIRIRGNRILASEAFRATIRPRAPMDSGAIKVHRLREQDVASGQTMTKVLPDLLRFIGSQPLVGYWISFDVRMLNKYLFGMLRIHLPNRQIDISKLYYDRKFGSAPPGTRIDLRYATILADLDLPARAQHDAFEDALGAAECYLVLEDMRTRGVRLRRRPPENRGDFSVA